MKLKALFSLVVLALNITTASSVHADEAFQPLTNHAKTEAAEVDKENLEMHKSYLVEASALCESTGEEAACVDMEKWKLEVEGNSQNTKARGTIPPVETVDTGDIVEQKMCPDPTGLGGANAKYCPGFKRNTIK